MNLKEFLGLLIFVYHFFGVYYGLMLVVTGQARKEEVLLVLGFCFSAGFFTPLYGSGFIIGVIPHMLFFTFEIYFTIGSVVLC